MKKVVLITGSSSSLGVQLAKKYIEEDCITYGIAKDSQNLLGLQYVPCDITNYENCKVVVEKIISEQGKIDILINNASISANISPFEDYTKKEIKEFFDVNLLGTMNITKAVVPHMREQKSGVILNISSVYSPFGLPYQTLFATQKAAIDGFSSSLRMELKEFNINVITAHTKRTNFADDANFMVQEDAEYYNNYKNAHKHMVSENKKGVNPKRMARVIYKTTMKNSPPIKMHVGVKNYFSRLLLSLIPKKLKENHIRKKYIKNREKQEKIKKAIQELNNPEDKF